MRNFKLHTILLQLLIIGLCAVSSSCSTDPKVNQPYVETDAKYYNANLRGLTYNGNTPTIEVRSNTYWVIRAANPDIDNWFTLSKNAGDKDQTITIEMQRNEGLQRSAVLNFETNGQATAQITIVQAGTEEVVYFYKDNLGAGASNVSVNDYKEWTTEGIGVGENRYEGEGTFVDSSNPSAGYDGASAGNNIHFAAANSYFTIGNCVTKGDYNFTLSFALKTPTAQSIGRSATKFNVYISQDRQKWTKFPYILEGGATPGSWSYVRAPFFIKEDCPNLFFKFESPEAAEYRLDDISLEEGIGVGEQITFDEDIVTIIRHNIISEDFAWADDQTTGDGAMPGSDGRRVDNMPGYSSCGWVADPIYVRAKKSGFLKCGYTNQGAGLYSPKFVALAGKTQDVTVTMDISGYANTAQTNLDFDKMVFRVVGQGTVDGHNAEKTFNIGSWNKMVPMELKIIGANAETQFYIASGVADAEQVAASKSNRWFIDNVKVFYTTEKEDGFVNEIILGEELHTFLTPGGEQSVSVNSNIGWRAETSAGWLILSPAESDAGASKLTVVASKNDTKAERRAIVNFMVDSEVVTTLSVVQEYSSTMPTMTAPTQLKVISAMPYHLAFNWQEPQDNTARKYKVSISQSETGEAIVEWVVPYNAKYTNAGFTFCGLEHNTSYYMRVVSISADPATVADSPQVVIKATTSTANTAPSASLAFQNFDNMRWGGDHLLNTYGLRPKGMSATTAPDAVADELKAPNDGGSSDVFNTHNDAFRAQRGVSDWYGLRAYEYPGYLTLGGASQTGFITTPVLSKINSEGNVVVNFSLGNRNEPSADGTIITIDKAVIRIGVVDQTVSNNALKTQANIKTETLLTMAGIRFVDQAIVMHTEPYTWKNHSIEVPAVKSTDRIIIYSLTNGTASTGAGRFFIDNVNVMPK